MSDYDNWKTTEPDDVLPPEDEGYSVACPKCGGATVSGYGLMGGGIGCYTFCSVDGCDYFHKIQDAKEP